MYSDPFQYNNYTVHRKMLKLFGGVFRVLDPNDQLALYADMKAFKLKEDIRLYSDENKQQELLVIKARSIIDFSAAYDVVDPLSGQKIGALKRKGFKSMLRDEWVIMDSVDNEIGYIKEDSTLMAVIRRIAGEFIPFAIPQNFTGALRGVPVLEFKQNFNPFAHKLMLDFSMDTQNLLDKRMGIAAAVLMMAIEGKQH